ncbi:uncharacterized protein P884DRAFT_113004 [Thermothelomyces heterothallicus CBS 202.75]|uniref:uncharacterized protein n=1 Tax=Thermothelomyces heterothallicus CBS 202.75 TaxID=1149848 RepID=UPI003743C543
MQFLIHHLISASQLVPRAPMLFLNSFTRNAEEAVEITGYAHAMPRSVAVTIRYVQHPKVSRPWPQPRDPSQPIRSLSTGHSRPLAAATGLTLDSDDSSHGETRSETCIQSQFAAFPPATVPVQGSVSNTTGEPIFHGFRGRGEGESYTILLSLSGCGFISRSADEGKKTTEGCKNRASRLHHEVIRDGRTSLPGNEPFTRPEGKDT